MKQVKQQIHNHNFQLVYKTMQNTIRCVVKMLVTLLIVVIPNLVLTDFAAASQYFTGKVAVQGFIGNGLILNANTIPNKTYFTKNARVNAAIKFRNYNHHTNGLDELVADSTSASTMKLIRAAKLQENTPIPVQNQPVETKINIQFLNEKKLFDIWSKLVIFSSRSNQTITEPISVPNLKTKQHWIYRNPTIYHYT